MFHSTKTKKTEIGRFRDPFLKDAIGMLISVDDVRHDDSAEKEWMSIK